MPAIKSQPLNGEEPWIPAPREAGIEWPDRTIYGGEATWSPYKGRHQPCGLCVEVIHGRKTGGAHPNPATMRRKGPNGESFVCAQHGTQWKIRDEQIRAKLSRMRADADVRARIPQQRGR